MARVAAASASTSSSASSSCSISRVIFSDELPKLYPTQPRQLDLEPLGDELMGVAIGVDLDQQRL